PAAEMWVVRLAPAPQPPLRIACRIVHPSRLGRDGRKRTNRAIEREVRESASGCEQKHVVAMHGRDGTDRVRHVIHADWRQRTILLDTVTVNTTLEDVDAQQLVA